MSNIRLNIIDQSQIITGEVHGSVGDLMVAALTAEPETVGELELVLGRFLQSDIESLPFKWFRQGGDFEPYDAGILIIDLAARVVAVESSYSLPSRNGEVCIRNPSARSSEEEMFIIPYQLSDDWLVVYSLPEYEGVCRRRREARLNGKPVDERAVLFGKPLLEFIAQEIFTADDVDDEELFTKIHAKWLMTARDDLQGKTPREVLLAKQHFIDKDLQYREMQWSFTGQCPPPLPLDSPAYHYAGFGTHEAVVYYDLLRLLLSEAYKYRLDDKAADLPKVVAYLEEVKEFWLKSPNRDYSGTIPAHYIDNERRRIPFAMSAHEAIIDEDCPVCQALASDPDFSPMFRHLDGSRMDNQFEFSFHATREEWAGEQREWEEFTRKFELERRQREQEGLSDGSLPALDESEPFIN